MIAITDSEFFIIVDYIKENFGINLSAKRTLVSTRLQNVLAENGYKSFSQYFEKLTGDKTGQAEIEMLNKLTTNHTFFMREERHFNYFRTIVLPQLKNNCIMERDLRIWSAGRSTGEEPYTLVMLLWDFFYNDKYLWNTKILATDISTSALQKAEKGMYSNKQMESIPDEWKRKYFKKISTDEYVVKSEIKEEVIYRRFNLNNQVFPFRKKFHVIFCRNVMIYFDNQVKQKLIEKFYSSMEYGGYLFIGHSESLNSSSTMFKQLAPSVHRKE